MKNLLLIAAIAALALTGCSSKVVTQDGTQEFPFLISTAAQLKQLADEVNSGDDTRGKYYKLTADISLSDYQSGEGWTPIGGMINHANWSFFDHFDGGGHVISDLKIVNPNNWNQDIGLFGYIGNGNEGSGSIRNLGVKGTVDAGNRDFVGGIVGRLSGKMEHCYWMGNVTGNENVGGCVGYSLSNASISHCWATGAVTGRKHVGGIVGYQRGISVYLCVALNEKIARTPPGSTEITFGRVVGKKEDGTHTSNVAWNNMPLPAGVPFTNDLNGKDGMSVGILLIRQASSYELYCPTPPWTREDTKLPGLGGRTVDIPSYIN